MQTTQIQKAADPIEMAGRLLALISAAIVCTRAELDPDLWWHLRAGLDMLRDGHLTSIDPYSFTQDVPWINHEWLSEAIMALSFRSIGVPGLVLMKSVVLACAFWLLASVVRPTAEPRRWWLLAFAVIAVAFSGTTVRPQLWTILAIAALMRLLPTAKGVYVVPVMFAVWANLHGGWIVGLAVAASWVLGRWIDTRNVGSIARPAVALAIALAATLVNPYGPGLWTFLASTVRVTRNLTEWQPVWRQAELTPVVLWLIVACGIVGATFLGRAKRVTWAAALPVAWLGAMSLLVARIVPIFGEVAAASLASSWAPKPANPRTVPRPSAVLALDVLIVTALCSVNFVSSARCLTTNRWWAPDFEAAGTLSSHISGRLVLPYDWGGLALWHWGPSLRVSIDPRRETVYSETTVATQSAVRYGLPEGLEFLERQRPEYVWEPNTSEATESWLRQHGYSIDVRTQRSFVARRSDLPALQAAPALSRCFP